MTSLETRSRRALIKAGILTTAGLILAPAQPAIGSPLVAIEPCTGRRTAGIRAPLTGPAKNRRPRFVNPWIDPKGDFRP
jgi:hypothetical protein